MKKLMQNALLCSVLAGFVFLSACNTENTVKPPVAKKVAKELSIHDQTRTDNYYWLNDRENPEVIDYLNQENAYTDALLKSTEGLQEKLYNEMIGRIKQNDNSVPYFYNGYWNYVRYAEKMEYPIYCRKKDKLENAEEIMLDVNELAKGFAYYSASGLTVSDNNNLLAYGEDTLSRRVYTIRFKNLQTGEMLPDKIENTTGSAVWAADNKTVFFTRKDDALRSYKIFRYQVGNPNSLTEIFHEKDETFSTFVYRSKSAKYIIIGSSATVSNEYQILPANTPEGKFTMFSARKRDLEYSIEHAGDKFYVVTNLEAKNFRLMETAENKTDMQFWKEVIAHRPDVLISGLDVFANHMVLVERKNGLNHLRVFNKKTNEDYYVTFEEEVYTVGLDANYDMNSEILRFNYTSLTTPNSVFDFSFADKSSKLMKETEVGGGFDAKNYETKRLMATAVDGTQIPISVVYKKGTVLDGNNNLLLYGYGSYGASMDPYFSSTRLSLLDRGFVFAIAHIRGGQEMGRAWYEEGKLLKKKNTFTDFIDCAKYLVEQKYTNSEKMFAMGGSAGGLLIGAVINMEPTLFKGVIAAVPFVDVVTTMLDETIPLTTGEFDEWGNPKVKAYYDYMLSYSPYDNVEAKNYCNILVTTGLHDSQVQYWEPAKWVAKLRELKTDSNLLLLRTNMETGHGGASGRFKRFKETATDYAFLFHLAGIKE
ncbi:MAG TPA: oligopeptidase B [Bacteroidales bacterium]|nr:oligopeptidase B [Bacteroidales bacterium]